MNTALRVFVFGSLLSLFSFTAIAGKYDQSDLWSDIPRSLTSRQNIPEVSRLAHYRALTSDTTALRKLLLDAPERASAHEGERIDLPLPDGKFVRFRIFSDSIMEATLAEKFPQLTTYWGYDESDPRNRGRFDLTERGFHGMFSYKGERVFVDPVRKMGANAHISYRKRDATPRSPFFDKVVIEPGYQQQWHLERAAALAPTQPDGLLRTYRLAVATTGEYTQFHGGTVSGGLSAVVTTMNRVNEVYEVDFSVRLTLVGNNDALIYTNPNTDPYTNGNSDLNSNTGNINRVIGASNYDIGHIFQTSGGGVAGLGVVCSSSKGRGLTGLQQPVGDPFYIDYVAHEMGHQFDALHTFNGTSGACGGGNRSGSAAYEPGSGATIMAYAGICSDENLQNNSDAYFHTHSISEVNAFITNGGGRTCAAISTLNNTPPTADAGVNYTIPAGTPFTLEGSANDVDSGDNARLTYVWEQYDLGSSSSSPATMVDNGNRPIFRSFTPAASPSRTFPNLDDLLSGTSTLGVSLPSTNRDLNFRLTVRDTRGGVAIDDMVVNVSNTGQAFEISAPNAGAVLNGGQSSAIGWNVAGTDSSPINCVQVDVDFSSDNGGSFSTIANALPNSGSATIILPNSATNDARLKVRCRDNIFFAMSARFNVQVGGPNQAPFFVQDPITKASAAAGTNYNDSLASDANDPDGNPLTFDKTSGPAWLNVAANGDLSGTPTTADIGVNAFGVSVSDGEFSDSATLNITVTEAVSTVGITEVLGSTTSTQNRRAMPFVMPEDGTLNSVSMYHNGGGGDMILAVYDDDSGLPGSRIASTADTAVNPITGWQTIDLQTPVFVSAGTQIWLAWIYEDNPGIYFSSGSPGRANVNITWSNASDNMPVIFGSSTQANFRYSIYASYVAGGGGNSAPVFLSDPIVKPNATENQSYSGSLANDASDSDGDVLTFSKIEGPAWLNVDIDGALSGTPATADLGVNQFTVEVSDSVASASAILEIEVTDAGPVTQTVGITTIGTSTSVSGLRRAMPYTMPAPGDINSVSIYHAGGNGGLILAIYDDNGGLPGALLGTSGEVTLSAAEGWQTVALQSPVFLDTDTTFWIAWIFQSNPGIRYVSGGPGRAQSTISWQSGGDNMPGNFGSSTQRDFRYSVYANFLPR